MTLVKFLQVPHTCGRLEQLRANKYILIELLRVSNILGPLGRIFERFCRWDSKMLVLNFTLGVCRTETLQETMRFLKITVKKLNFCARQSSFSAPHTARCPLAAPTTTTASMSCSSFRTRCFAHFSRLEIYTNCDVSPML